LHLQYSSVKSSDVPPTEAIKRKLLEETGHTSKELINAYTIPANTANHVNLVYCFLVLNAELVGTPHLNDTEQIEAVS